MQHLRFSYKGYTGIRSRTGVWVVLNPGKKYAGYAGSLKAALNLICYQLDYERWLATWIK